MHIVRTYAIKLKWQIISQVMIQFHIWLPLFSIDAERNTCLDVWYA